MQTYQQLKKYTSTALLVVALTLLSSTYLSAKNITLAASYWPDYTNKDGTGVYLDTIKAVFAKSDIKVIIKFMPWARASYTAKHHEVDGLIGDYDQNMKEFYIPKWHIGVETITAFYHHKRQDIIWQGIKTIRPEKYKISWIKGYGYEKIFNIDISKIYTASSVKSGVLLLLNNRVDILLDYDSNVDPVLKDLNEDPNVFVRHYINSDKKLYLVFANNPRGREYADIFDKGMSNLHRENTLNDIYLKYTGYPFALPLTLE